MLMYFMINQTLKGYAKKQTIQYNIAQAITCAIINQQLNL